MAADLPSAAPAPAPYIAPPPLFTWTGFYVGVNAGGNFEGWAPSFAPTGIAGGTTLLPDAQQNGGFVGGGQIGYNWQVSQFVLGVEADLDYMSETNVNGRYNSPGFYQPVGGGSTYTISGGRSNQLYGTVRGRLGWTWDRFLVYATGGAAFGGNASPSSIAFTTGSAGCAGAGCLYSRSGNNDVGAVVGGGVEYAFAPNWTAKVEYLHTFYGKTSYTNGFGQTFRSGSNDWDNNIVRAGLNYKF
jgi:outer membrane immunogenic protein